MSAAPAPSAAAPAAASRLLAGWYDDGRAATLADHTARYGPLPPRGYRRPSGPAEFTDAVDESGLTGRGGAGFPTGRKMRAVARSAAGRGAVVVANGAESEPASTKDRVLLSVAPHLVLDGAALAADAVDATEIFLAVHAGVGLTDQLRVEVAARSRASIHPVPVHIFEPPRRYVSSEETALVQWISGGPAQPAFTPPRPYERGVHRRPTLVNNVETLAHLALLARYGPDWFRSIGTPHATGSLLVTLGGAVRQPGVYEVAMGTSIGEAIAQGGGPSQPLQAVLVGGYFGSWLPIAQATALPMTHLDLLNAGAGLGAGVLFALPTGACGLAETARVFRYLADESAGQCGPCRNGLPAIADDLALVAAGGRSLTGVRNRLQQRLQIIEGRGACHHPDGAVRFAASALRAFAADAAAHLRHKPCAGVGIPPLLPLPGPIERDRGWR